MVRRYEEAIEVRTEDDAPHAFVWRGRVYLVREVLDRWQERRPWWRDALEDLPAGMSPGEVREHQVWRVAASPGRLQQVGVFELATLSGPGPRPQSAGAAAQPARAVLPARATHAALPTQPIQPIQPTQPWLLLRAQD